MKRVKKVNQRRVCTKKLENWLLWTLRRMINLMWTPRRNLSIEMDSVWPTKDPHFINNKNPMVTCWQGFLTTYFAYPKKPQTDCLASHTMPCLFIASELTIAGEHWFLLSSIVLRSVLSNLNDTNYILIFIYTYQSELNDLAQSEPFYLEITFTWNGPEWEFGWENSL